MFMGFLISLLVITCQTNRDPAVVTIGLPTGINIDLPYDTYQALRTTLGLPDVICEA